MSQTDTHIGNTTLPLMVFMFCALVFNGLDEILTQFFIILAI